MKKILIVFLAIVLLFVSCATTAKAPVEMLSITEIIEIPHAQKEQLYVKANEWAVSVFKNANSVIQYSDKEAGKIVGKYASNIPVGMGQTKKTTSTITIDVKDDKARITIDQPYYELTVRVGTASSHEEGTVEDMNTITKLREEWIVLVNSFEKMVTTPAETNW